MIREKITTKDYERISKENDYFLWHFTMKDVIGNANVFSIFKEDYDGNRPHLMKSILDIYNIPYYESDIKDSLDFLDMIGIPLQKLWVKKENEFKPFIFGFKKKRLVVSTLDGYCMCAEGITDLLFKLNPEIVLNAKLD